MTEVLPRPSDDRPAASVLNAQLFAAPEGLQRTTAPVIELPIGCRRFHRLSPRWRPERPELGVSINGAEGAPLPFGHGALHQQEQLDEPLRDHGALWVNAYTGSVEETPLSAT